MNLTDERKLKFDRRLHSRRGWVSEEELQAELDSLPDVSHKIATPEEDEASAAAARPAAPATSPAESVLPE